MPCSILLFDIDGTLLLTGGAGKKAFNRIFSECFHVENAWGNTSPDGKTDPAIIHEVSQGALGRRLTPEEYQEVCRRYERYFAEEIVHSDRFRVLPGVKETLASLHQSGRACLGIATGNFEATAQMKLRKGGLEHYFRFGGYALNGEDRTELTRQAVLKARAYTGREVSPEEIFLVGDTIHDIHAGKHLGIRTVAIPTGGTPASALQTAAPDFLIKEFTELLEILDFS